MLAGTLAGAVMNPDACARAVGIPRAPDHAWPTKPTWQPLYTRGGQEKVFVEDPSELMKSAHNVALAWVAWSNT